MIHLAEKSIHEALALFFIQAEFFQKYPDAFTGKAFVQGVLISQSLMLMGRERWQGLI